jgi:hypothetical protein
MTSKLGLDISFEYWHRIIENANDSHLASDSHGFDAPYAPDDNQFPKQFSGQLVRQGTQSVCDFILFPTFVSIVHYETPTGLWNSGEAQTLFRNIKTTSIFGHTKEDESGVYFADL